MDSSRSATSASSRHGHEVDEERPTKRARLNPSIEVGLMRDGSSSRDSASFVGSASGIYFIRSVYGALKAHNTPGKLTGETPESNIVPGEDDRLNVSGDGAPPQAFWEPSEVNSGETSFKFNDLLDWTCSYFENWHPAFPFLHAPTILQQLEALAEHNIDRLSLFDQSIIKAILSISLADRRQSSSGSLPVPDLLVFRTFDDALDSIQAVMTRPVTIHGLQAAVCVQLFLISMLRLNAASRLGGLIIRMAFQLGLHRCPAKYTSFKPAEQELRRRLFWSIYCLDRHICQALGLPLTVQDNDVDVCYPNSELHNIQHLVLAEERSDGPSSSHSENEDDRLAFMTLITKHAQIRGLIIELRNKRVEQRGETWDKAVMINARLTQWWNTVEDSIDQAELREAPFSIVHQTVLKILKHESVISLNRPLLTSSKDSPNYTSALHSCISASKSIIKALSSLTYPVPTFRMGGIPSDPQPTLFWPSFTWSVWMSAFILLYAALENEIDYQVTVRNTDRALQLLAKLATRGSVWPTACAVAIRDLRSTLDETRATQPPATSRPIEHAASSTGEEIISAKGLSLLGGLRADSKEEISEPLNPQKLPDGPRSVAVAVEPTPGPSWLDLGMDLGADLPLFPNDGLDLLQGFDIPFWMGQDNYTTWMGT